MVYGYRYIQLDEDGRVKASCDTEIEGVTIDTEDMEMPEQPVSVVSTSAAIRARAKNFFMVCGYSFCV